MSIRCSSCDEEVWDDDNGTFWCPGCDVWLSEEGVYDDTPPHPFSDNQLADLSLDVLNAMARNRGLKIEHPQHKCHLVDILSS